MKLDVSIDNPLNLTAKVYLDGVEQKGCLVADEEAGYVIRYIDFDRYFCLKGTVWPTEKVRGKVQIEVPK